MSMIFTDRLDKAIRTAAWTHDAQGQRRKASNVPFVVHPFGVMVIASQATSDEDVLVAALLHDVLEDVDEKIYSEADMQRDFGPRVLGLVRDVSHDKVRRSWHERSQLYLDHLKNEAAPESAIISAADKINNLRSIIIDYKVEGEKLWRVFRTGNPDDQLWFFSEVAKVARARTPESPLPDMLEQGVAELRQLITDNLKSS